MYNNLNDRTMERFDQALAEEVKFRMDCVLSTIANRMQAFPGDILMCHSLIMERVLHTHKGAVCGFRATAFDLFSGVDFKTALNTKSNNEFYEWIMNIRADNEGNIEVRLYETSKRAKEMDFNPTSVFKQTEEGEVRVYKVHDLVEECEVSRS